MKDAPQVELAMPESKTLNYMGNRKDLVGSVIGPDAKNKYWIITETEYFDCETFDGDPDNEPRDGGSWTEATLVPYSREMGSRLPADKRADFTIQQRQRILEQSGVDMGQALIPEAFRRRSGPATMGLQ